MKYIIIGLGNYGSVLAEELSALGHEVIGVDMSAMLRGFCPATSPSPPSPAATEKASNHI